MSLATDSSYAVKAQSVFLAVWCMSLQTLVTINSQFVSLVAGCLSLQIGRNKVLSRSVSLYCACQYRLWPQWILSRFVWLYNVCHHGLLPPLNFGLCSLLWVFLTTDSDLTEIPAGVYCCMVCVTTDSGHTMKSQSVSIAVLCMSLQILASVESQSVSLAG